MVILGQLPHRSRPNLPNLPIGAAQGTRRELRSEIERDRGTAPPDRVRMVGVGVAEQMETANQVFVLRKLPLIDLYGFPPPGGSARC